MNQFQQEIENLLTKADKKTDQQLYGLYVDTIKDLKKALLVDYQRYEELSSTEQLKLSRMTSLLEQLDKSTKELKQGLKTEISSYLESTGKIAYNELFYEYESKNTAINFTMLKSEELKTIIETPVANYKLSERLNDGVAEKLKANVKTELTRVFLQGYSYKETAARLAELGYSSYRRALNITRTEAGRVQAIARQKSQTEAMKLGIEFEKEWISTLDNRTRNNHAKLDGQRVEPDEDFEVGGLKAKQPHMFGVASEDCNCRCRTVSRLKNDKNTRLRRDNETGKIGVYENYYDWAEKTGRLKRNTVTLQTLQTLNCPKLPKGIRFNETTRQFERLSAKTSKEVLQVLERAQKSNEQAGRSLPKTAGDFYNWLKKNISIFDEKIEKYPGFDYTESAITLRAKKFNIDYNVIKKLKKPKAEKKIISAVGGGDLTDGSCSSLAMAYIGNKHGYDVLDYRGGNSQLLFAYKSTIKQMGDFEGVNLRTALAKDEIQATVDLLADCNKSKEYYLAVSEHAAVVKNINGIWHYLELQTEDSNGWFELTPESLKERFGASSRRRKLREIMLYDTEELGNSPEFKTALGYLNTNTGNQVKGSGGYAK